MSLVAVPQLSIQELRSDFSGKSAVIDALLTRYEQLEADASKLRVAIFSDDLTYESSMGVRYPHPLFGPLLATERLLHLTMRELGFSVRMYDSTRASSEDSVDTFLASMNAQHRPHHAMNRPIDASST